MRHNRRSYTTAAVVLLLGSATAGAGGFRAPVPLGELIAGADAVVLGTIAHVGDERFVLTIAQVLAGTVENDALEVEKFPAPSTTPRWAIHAPGQTVLLFLEHATSGPDASAAEDHIGRWRILGRIGEGEIPLDTAYAYFHGRHLQGFERSAYVVDGQAVNLQRFDREQVVEAVGDYRQCFTLAKDASGAARLRAVCDPTRLAAYRTRSAFHEILVKQAAGRH